MKWQRELAEIQELYDKYKNFKLILKPFFQRNLVWTESAKSSFIETILLKMPISEIYLLEENGILSVIDGQQRLSTIFSFIDEKFTLNNKVRIPNKIYSKIDKNLFNTYQISFIKITETSKEEVIDMYSRINQYTVNLNEQELRKATFSDSDFLKLSEELSEEEFFDNAKFFTPRKRQRMNDVEYISELLCLFLEGVQDKKNQLNNFYERYGNISNYLEVKNGFQDILKNITNLFTNKSLYNYFSTSKYDGSEGDINLGKTRFRQFADFYSLFMVIKDIRDIHLNENQQENILKILIFLTEMIEPEADIELLREYAIKCVSQGNTKQSRLFRENVLKSLFFMVIENTHNDISIQLEKEINKIYNIAINLLDFDLDDTLNKIDSYYENLDD